MSSTLNQRRESSFSTFTGGKKYSQVFIRSKDNSQADLNMSFSDLIPRVDIPNNFQSTFTENEMTNECIDDISAPSLSIYSKTQRDRSITGFKSKRP